MKTNLQLALLNHLQMDELEFENKYFEKYMRYCLGFSTRFNLHYQNVLSNRSVSLWYRFQFLKYEQEAFNMLELSTGKLEQKIQLYEMVTDQIFSWYPSAILPELKKVEIINPPIPYN